ncbi:MAG: hypothetical protein J2P31_04370, partial [Blastocatellia bacterium]|nr:hypothetical protein [Blastocatellia bacterium]
NYDSGFDLSGPVPRLKNKLLLFGSFNPTIRREIVRGAEGSGLRTILGDETSRRYYTKNYAFKTDVYLTQNHQLNFSIFGDPSSTNNAPFRTLNIDNTTADSKIEYGTRNIAVRYNGTINPSWTVNASFSQGRNHFNELGFDNFAQITDLTQTAAGQRGQFTAVGLGFFEPTEGRTYRGTIDTQKRAAFLGEHTFGAGYTYQKAFYEGLRDRSGPKYTIPATNADGTLDTIPASIAGQPLNAQFRLRRASDVTDECTLCPLMMIPNPETNVLVPTPVALQQIRGEFGNPVFDTRGSYNAAYLQDTWKINRYVTALLGYRWEQEQVIGAILPQSGTRNAYTFTGQWSPRFGVTVDPFGKGKTKIYFNFGRFHEYLPLDAAERSLSSEKDFTGGWFAPDFDPVTKLVKLNQFGTVTPVIDSAHLLSGAAGGIDLLPGTSAQDVSNPIVPGTKLGYTDEHLWGFEQQLPNNWVLSVRFIDRHIGRIIEDAASVSPEGALAGIGQTYYIGNINSKFDAAQNLQPLLFTPSIVTINQTDFVTNTPTGCVTSPSGVAGIGPQPKYFFATGNSGVCFTQAGIDADGNGIVRPDGNPDGFPDPVRKYRAIEVELNKRFSGGWQLLSNYRYATLRGNYEGHLRNDNGQTDPGISSLFDFTQGALNLLGDQFATGTLNTERRHIINIYGSYELGRNLVKFLKGLNVGTNLRMNSGIPISELLAHPVYLNAGEIPVGGRGKLGRTPFYTSWDMHFDYRWSLTERLGMRIDVDIFNVPNSQLIRTVNQFRELDGGVLNVDFTNPTAFYPPRSLRLGMRMDF